MGSKGKQVNLRNIKANKSSLPPNPNTAAKLRQNIVTPVDASSLNNDI